MTEVFTDWDAIVAGAGPAGSVAARQLVRMGFRVLLVDQNHFPRDKVCGTCLNHQAISVLRGVGLSRILSDLGAVELRRFHVAGWGRRAEVPLPAGFAVSRAALDAALIRSAILEGTVFQQRTRVTARKLSEDSRKVHVTTEGTHQQIELRCRILIDATGLGGLDPGVDESVLTTSRIGLGCHLLDSDDFESHTIHMAVGEGGYVGVVRLNERDLNLAAAIDPVYLREWKRPSQAVARLLHESGLPVPPGIHEAKWHGTRPLTRSPKSVSETRLFRVGDAAGYVEPFTGEGMAWAVRGAIEVAPLAAQAIHGWRQELATEWHRRHRKIVSRRQWFCRMVAGLLRRPKLSRLALRLLSFSPRLASPVVRHLNPTVSFAPRGFA